MRKVMLVEDEAFILEGLQKILDWEEMGMKIIHTASNGEEALLLWEKEPADVIVTDINMPKMDGLLFLEELRKLDKRARCIILTGYDEFDYARKAIPLDVEDYILKPIDEEKLEAVLRVCLSKLDEIDKSREQSMDDKPGWIQFLRGIMEPAEKNEIVSLLPVIKSNGAVLALMKLELESLKGSRLTDVLFLLKEENIRSVYLSADTMLLLMYDVNCCEEAADLLSAVQNRLESLYGILSYISIGSHFYNYSEVPISYQTALKLEKYRVIEGYGSCITQERIEHRGSQDIFIDDALLRKLILKKDKEKAVDYIEDLFFNNFEKDASVDDLYQMCIRMAMILQEMKEEYKLLDHKNMQNLTEMIGGVYEAEDLFTVKTIFIGEIAEMIACLHEEDSHYTPVVRQIISEIQKNYKEDMNLKTLAYKYRMNASYLGQIFQKEVGCSFASYFTNVKNSIAKDLILNTNMRIHDIAKEVGYLDTSYFYRKFKQCYGVSPASLREMKKY